MAPHIRYSGPSRGQKEGEAEIPRDIGLPNMI